MLIEIVALIMVFTQFMDNLDCFLASNPGIIRLLVPGAIGIKAVGEKCEQESFVTDLFISFILDQTLTRYRLILVNVK